LPQRAPARAPSLTLGDEGVSFEGTEKRACHCALSRAATTAAHASAEVEPAGCEHRAASAVTTHREQQASYFVGLPWLHAKHVGSHALQCAHMGGSGRVSAPLRTACAARRHHNAPHPEAACVVAVSPCTARAACSVARLCQAAAAAALVRYAAMPGQAAWENGARRSVPASRSGSRPEGDGRGRRLLLAHAASSNKQDDCNK
jgi:hypothetical protein